MPQRCQCCGMRKLLLPCSDSGAAAAAAAPLSRPRQALCKRYGLEIGAYCSWIVRLLMWITFPVSWPLGKVRWAYLGWAGGCMAGRGGRLLGCHPMLVEWKHD